MLLSIQLIQSSEDRKTLLSSCLTVTHGNKVSLGNGVMCLMYVIGYRFIPN